VLNLDGADVGECFQGCFEFFILVGLLFRAHVWLYLPCKFLWLSTDFVDYTDFLLIILVPHRQECPQFAVHWFIRRGAGKGCKVGGNGRFVQICLFINVTSYGLLIDLPPFVCYSFRL
jgi:hypothetical protein